MTTHYLKISEKYWERILNKEKTCEIRLNDRDFQTHDEIVFLTLWEGDDRPAEGFFDGDYFKHIDRPFKITHVLHSTGGLRDGFVVLSIMEID